MSERLITSIERFFRFIERIMLFIERLTVLIERLLILSIKNAITLGVTASIRDKKRLVHRHSAQSWLLFA